MNTNGNFILKESSNVTFFQFYAPVINRNWTALRVPTVDSTDPTQTVQITVINSAGNDKTKLYIGDEVTLNANDGTRGYAFYPTDVNKEHNNAIGWDGDSKHYYTTLLCSSSTYCTLKNNSCQLTKGDDYGKSICMGTPIYFLQYRYAYDFSKPVVPQGYWFHSMVDGIGDAYTISSEIVPTGNVISFNIIPTNPYICQQGNCNILTDFSSPITCNVSCECKDNKNDLLFVSKDTCKCNNSSGKSNSVIIGLISIFFLLGIGFFIWLKFFRKKK